MLDDTKYNYVIYGADGYYEVGYHDLIGCTNVLFLRHYLQTISNPLARIVARFTFSKKVNQVFSYPFSSFTFKHLASFTFSTRRPICFLYFGNVYWYTDFLVNSPYFDYLKRRFPDAKFGMYIQDIVSRNPHIDISRVKEQFDFVLSYDKGDCEKYDLIYHPTPYSVYPVPQNHNITESDIYFCGKGKNRYETIYKIYDYCIQKGLKCDFHITGLSENAPKVDGIHYDKLSYIENLQHVAKTKCILEIMQSGANGFTPRVWESMIYNKHLLTNNSTFLSSPYCKNDSTHLVETDLDYITDWIKTPVKPIEEDKIHDLSPNQLIKHIESILSQNI